MKSHMMAVLRSLEADPKPLSQIARDAHVKEEEAQSALEHLVAHSLAIPEDGGYELSGPLSWFGSFEAAVRHHAGRNFIITVPGDPHSHLYVDDVRVKGARKAGDPLNETVAVTACGRTSLEAALAVGEEGPSCQECRDARASAV